MTYEISYPGMKKANPMFLFVSKKMNLTFKPHKYKYNLSAGYGIFNTNYIVNSETKEVAHLLKYFNQKYIANLNEQQAEEFLLKLPTYYIAHTNETKKILGYTCKKSIITYEDNPNDTLVVYHTDEMGLKDPNWFNEFNGISGVMLEYDAIRYGIHMRFKAKRIAFKRIEDQAFKIDKGYTACSMSKISNEMERIFKSVQ